MIKLKSSSFFQLLTGTALAQLIAILASPISTRLFSKEILGLYTLIITILSIFGPVLSGRYDISIVSSRNKSDELNLIIGSLFLGICSSVIITLCYFKFSFIGTLEHKNLISILLFFLLLFTAIINILTAYNNKKKEYLLMSQVVVQRTLFQNIFLVITGVLNQGVVGLLWSQLIGMFFGIKKQSSDLLKEKFKETVSFDKILKCFITEKKQLFFSVPATLLNTLSYSMINIFITSLYGLGIFGLYSISYRMLSIPLSLISTNLSKIFFQEISEVRKSNRQYGKIIKKYTLRILPLSIIFSIGLMLFSPVVFGIVFGKEWTIAGQYVRILAPMYGIRMLVSTLSVAFVIFEKQQIELILQLLFIITSSVIYLCSKIFGLDELIFLMLISLSYSLIYLIYYMAIIIYSRKEGVK